MSKRVEEARRAYRLALEAARAHPSQESWAELLAAGKGLSLAQEPKTRGARRSRRAATPTIQDLEGPAQAEAELEGLE